MKLFSGMQKLYLAIALAFWPCACTIPLWMDGGGWYELGIFLYFAGFLPLFLLPCYLVYLEFGAFIGRLTDGRERSRGERVLGYATSGMAGMLVVCLAVIPVDGLPTAIRYSGNILFWLCFAGLPFLWVVGAVKYKKRLYIKELLRPKGVWVTAIVLFLVFLSCGLGYRHLLELGYRYNRSQGWYNANDPLAYLILPI